MWSDAWREYVYRRGRNDFPALLWKAFEDEALDLGDLANAIASAWSSHDSPESALSREQWVELYRVTGFIHNGIRTSHEVKKPLLLFRGADFGRPRRMSWTEDEELARDFALRRLREGLWGTVFSSRVAPWRLIARNTSEREGENEWIINPSRLRVLVKATPQDLGYEIDFDTMKTVLVPPSAGR